MLIYCFRVLFDCNGGLNKLQILRKKLSKQIKWFENISFLLTCFMTSFSSNFFVASVPKHFSLCHQTLWNVHEIVLKFHNFRPDHQVKRKNKVINLFPFRFFPNVQKNENFFFSVSTLIDQANFAKLCALREHCSWLQLKQLRVAQKTNRSSFN